MASRILWALLILSALGKIEEEDGVWVLNEENLDEALSLQSDILIEFYAPWCTYCKKLAPEYSKAAKQLKAQSIRIAKIDGSTNSNLTEKHNIKNYPTLKYFSKSSQIDYTGSKSEAAIVSWVLKQSGQPFTIISTLEELKVKLESNKLSVVLFAEKDTKEFNLFNFVAKEVDDPMFYVCVDKKAWEFYKVKASSVVVFKQFDDKRVDYEGVFSTKEIAAFVERNKRPWVVRYDEELDELIFGKNKACLLVLRHESEAKEFDKLLKRLSRALEGKLLVAYSDISTEENRKLAGSFGLVGKKQPLAVILDPAADLRYILEDSVTEDSLKQFLKDWRAKKLEPAYKSESIPSKPFDKHIRIVVAKNFEEVVLDQNKDVLIEFYAPWCSHCKELAPKYEQLAKDLRHVDTLVIAKMDATANEIKGLKVKGYPTIKFYPAGNKKPIEYRGDLDAESLLDFIKKKATYKIEGKKDL